MRTDYQRFSMPEVESLEKQLTQTYFRESDYYDKVDSVLFNSGLNALEAIYILLDEESSRSTIYQKGQKPQKAPSPPIFRTGDMYFEVDHSIDGHYQRAGMKPDIFDPKNADELVQRIKTDLPQAVFLTPVSNTYEMEITPILEILEALTDEKWRKRVWHDFHIASGYATRHIYLIIDNSTAGRLACWKDFDFHKLPDFVRVISFESLVKYAQDGQDLVSAALVTAIGEYEAHNLVMIRGRHGFMPPENSVRKLAMTIPADLTDKKMQRHSRNALTIGENLQGSIRAGSFVSEVIFPGLPSHPQHEEAEKELRSGGGLLNIGFDFDFLTNYRESYKTILDDEFEFSKHAKLIAAAFSKLIVILAKQGGVEINQGTSFGFHTTRIALYERVIDKRKIIPYVRIATGTENIKDALLIAEVFKRANDIFTKAVRDRRVLKLGDLLTGRPEEVEVSFGEIPSKE